MTAFVAWLWAGPVQAQWRPDEEKPLPAGPEVMKGVRESMHGRIVTVSGSLQSLNADGEIAVSRPIRIRFDWTGDGPVVGVEIRDAFGTPIADATLRSDATGSVSVSVKHFDADGTATHDISDTNVPGLNVAWSDLSLGFLWWPGGVTEQEEMKLGRVCHVVRIPAPSAGSPYAAVRLWIDAQASALLQADGLDAKGKRIRRLAVRSLRKTEDGEWMIKDFELTGAGRGAPRAVLAFDSIEEETAHPESQPETAHEEKHVHADRDL